MQNALTKPRADIDQPLNGEPAHGVDSYVARRNWLLTVCLDLLLCLPLVALICFYDLNSPSINYRDETTHIRAVQEMRQNGDYWTPTVRGKPYFNKPPFKMWLTFIPLKVFGESAFSYRFLDALAGVLTCCLLYFFARFAFRSRVAGVLAPLLLIGCMAYVFGHGVRKAVQDSMLIFLDTLGTILGWLWLQALGVIPSSTPQTRLRTRLLAVAGGAAIGLAILTKSAAGIIPYGVFGTFLLLAGLLPTMLRKHKAQLMLVVATTLIVAGSYLVPHMLFTPGFFGTMVGQEIVTRTTEGYHNKSQLWFYFIRLFEDREGVPPELLTLSFIYFVGMWLKRRSHLHLFLAVWSTLPLVVFTLIPSRLTWYISPSFPGMSLMIAGTVAAAVKWLSPRLRSWWEGNSAFSSGIALAGVFLALSAGTSTWHLVAIGKELISMEPRNVADLLATDIIRYAEHHPGHAGIIRLRAPAYALHESTYGGMIDPLSVSTDDVNEALRLAESGGFALFMTSLPAFAEVAARKPIAAYRYLPPMYDRTQWMVAFTIDPKVHLRSLTLARQLLQFGGAATRVHFGLRPEERGATFRHLQGSRAAIPIEGDSALKTFGASAAVNLASRMDGTIQVEFLMNDRIVETLKLSASDFHTYRFEIPADHWANGTNVLFLRVTALDGQKILEDTTPLALNWLSIRLKQPNDQADSGNNPGTDK
ncbi:MAG: glycosyltransferase family 39 protein [Bdellovibrionota bacterium]